MKEIKIPTTDDSFVSELEWSWRLKQTIRLMLPDGQAFVAIPMNALTEPNIKSDNDET